MLSKSFSGKYDSSKKGLETINKFNYYVEQLYPDLFPIHSQNFQTIITTKNKEVCYHYFDSFAAGKFLTNQQLLLQCAKKTYLETDKNISKVNQTSFKKQTQVKIPFMPLWSNAHQVIDFIVRQPCQQSKTQTSQRLQKNLILYVLHHHRSEGQNSLKWLHFVQSYTISRNGISYRLAASCKKSGMMNYNEKLFTQFVERTAGAHQFIKMQGLILQYSHQIQEEIKKLEDPAYHPDHCLINKIPHQYLKTYYSLKSQFPSQEQSLICRFLIAKQFHLTQTRQALNAYLKWKTQITQKYTWKDFQFFDKQGIFRYLGEDRRGRPVIINRASKVLVNEFDHELYCAFYIYYLQIFLPKKMRGNVTQVTIIADVQDLGTDHFKFSVTKKNIIDSTSYSPQRQYKMIGVNVSSFALYWWKLVSPLLPKNTLEKITIAGNDREDILNCLLEDMDESVIPEYLGGTKKIDFNQPSVQ